MKRGYAGDFVPLLPAMLAGAAVDQGEGLAQPAKPHHTSVDPISSTSQPPIPSPPHSSPPPQSPLLASPPHPSPPPHSPHQSPPFSPPDYSPPRSYEASLPEGNTSGSAEDSMQLKELIDIVPKLVTRIETLETDLQQTKTTYGKAVLTLIKRVKILEKALKRKTHKVVISELEGEEPEDQGRIIQDIDDDPLVSLVRESMKENVSKANSTDKGKRYRRRARSMAKKINTGLDAEDEINTGIEDVNTGSAKVDSGTASKRGQREGKAPMVEEDIQATHKTKEQIRQEEAGLEVAIKLQAQMDEEVAKLIHLDELIAKRMAEEEALSEQQKKRKSQDQFEAQYYTEEDWDAIRAKLEANAELTKDALGKDVPEQDFAKRMVDMVNQRKKQKARKGISIDKNAQGDSETDKEESVEAINPTPLATKLSHFKKLKLKRIKRVEVSFRTKTSRNKRIAVNKMFQYWRKSCRSSKKEEEQVKRIGKERSKRLEKMIEKQAGLESDEVISLMWECLEIARLFWKIPRQRSIDIVLQMIIEIAGNPVKEILLKFNLPDHRSILTDSKMAVKCTKYINVKEFKEVSCPLISENISRSDGVKVFKLKNFKKDATLKLFKSTNQERYEHVNPEVTRSQDDKFTRWQNEIILG
ncbi:hypothetical protein Tco_0337432 [Tanacetum coccineum]